MTIQYIIQQILIASNNPRKFPISLFCYIKYIHLLFTKNFINFILIVKFLRLIIATNHHVFSSYDYFYASHLMAREFYKKKTFAMRFDPQKFL